MTSSAGNHASGRTPLDPTEPSPAGVGTAEAKGVQLSAQRKHAAAVTSRLVAQAVAATSGSQSRLAAALDTRREYVTRWCDAEHPNAMTLRDVLAAARSGERSFARVLLTSLLGVIDAETPRSPETMDVHIRRLMIRCGELAKRADEALRAGGPDDIERARLQRELGAVRAALYAMGADIEAGT